MEPVLVQGQVFHGAANPVVQPHSEKVTFPLQRFEISQVCDSFFWWIIHWKSDLAIRLVDILLTNDLIIKKDQSTAFFEAAILSWNIRPLSANTTCLCALLVGQPKHLAWQQKWSRPEVLQNAIDKYVWPLPSRYGIFTCIWWMFISTYIYHKHPPNVGKYTIGPYIYKYMVEYW